LVEGGRLSRDNFSSRILNILLLHIRIKNPVKKEWIKQMQWIIPNTTFQLFYGFGIDSSYCFLSVNVGAFGRERDPNIFTSQRFFTVHLDLTKIGIVNGTAKYISSGFNSFFSNRWEGNIYLVQKFYFELFSNQDYTLLSTIWTDVNQLLWPLTD